MYLFSPPEAALGDADSQIIDFKRELLSHSLFGSQLKVELVSLANDRGDVVSFLITDVGVLWILSSQLFVILLLHRLHHEIVSYAHGSLDQDQQEPEGLKRFV